MLTVSCFRLVSVGLFLLLCFLYREIILAFIVRLLWNCWFLLVFILCKALFLCQISISIFLGRLILICRFSHYIILYMALWPAVFLLKNQLITLWVFYCIFCVCVTFLSIFEILIFFFAFNFLTWFIGVLVWFFWVYFI